LHALNPLPAVASFQKQKPHTLIRGRCD
jgi:hypothetical protein